MGTAERAASRSSSSRAQRENVSMQAVMMNSPGLWMHDPAPRLFTHPCNRGCGPMTFVLLGDVAAVLCSRLEKKRAAVADGPQSCVFNLNVAKLCDRHGLTSSPHHAANGLTAVRPKLVDVSGIRRRPRADKGPGEAGVVEFRKCAPPRARAQPEHGATNRKFDVARPRPPRAF